MLFKNIILSFALCNALYLPFDQQFKAEEFVEVSQKHAAPLLLSSTARPHLIRGEYIVEFMPNTKLKTIETHLEQMGAKLIEIGEFRGYAGKFSEPEVRFIRNSGIVKYVEHDSRVSVETSQAQYSAPWGLARLSHREHLTIRNYAEYLYDDEGGEGVTAYVVDSGINTNHTGFEGRASWGTTTSDAENKDTHGHGTHVAGTIGSKSYGVAKKVAIVAVKVLDTNGSGSISNVIKGLEWVVAQHKESTGKGSTANLSLGGGKSAALESALNAAVGAGVHIAVAAGNANVDACSVSPGAASAPISVGAVDLSDSKASFSNWGKCVDIWGPGVNVISTSIDASNHGSKSMSGTSMASPHICGLMAYFLSLQPKIESQYSGASITPEQLKKHLLAFGTKNLVNGLDSSSTNLVPFNGAGKALDGFHKAIEMLTELEF